MSRWPDNSSLVRVPSIHICPPSMAKSRSPPAAPPPATLLSINSSDSCVRKRKATPMMGTKERHFAPLINASLEDLVPADHFYRHLEQSLDVSFVREFVQQTYAGGGRPSIDPIVFFK